MSGISTHILDLTRGRPAADIVVVLQRLEKSSWCDISTHRTDQDGRILKLLPEEVPLQNGVFRLRFETRAYFDSLEIKSFYPFIEITIQVWNVTERYHVPLLLTPYSYSTYRGS